MASRAARRLVLPVLALLAPPGCTRLGFSILSGPDAGTGKTGDTRLSVETSYSDIARDIDPSLDSGKTADTNTTVDLRKSSDLRFDGPPPDKRPADKRQPDAPLVPVSFLTNGDFAQGKTGWVEAYDPGCGGARTVSIVADAPHPSAVELKATGAGGCFGTSRIEQPLSVAVNSYSSITLDAAVRAVSCSVVHTCGVAGTEHVVILRVHYAEGGGTAKKLVFGIYYSTGAPDETCASPQAPANETWVTRKVQKDTWSSFSSGNLKTWIPAGSTITGLVAYASGWDYLSRVTNIQLVGQP